MTNVRRQTDEMFQQLRALFAAGRIAIRGPGRILEFIRDVDRQVRELDHLVRDRPSEFSNAAFGVDGAEADALAGELLDTSQDAADCAEYILGREVAALEAIGARHRAGHARNEATRFLGWDPAPGGDQTVRIGYEIATVHLEDDGLLERDDRRFAYECTRCGRLWDECEIVQARDLASIGIGRRAFYIDRPDGGHVSFVTGPVELVLDPAVPADPVREHAAARREMEQISDIVEQRARSIGERSPRTFASEGFTTAIPISDSPANRDAFDALLRAVHRPAEVAPDHARKLAPASPKLPLYRPT